MITIFDNSGVTENAPLRVQSGSDERASLLAVEVVDEGSWTGSIKMNARIVGRGKQIADEGGDPTLPASFTAYLAFGDRTFDLAPIDGDTGITEAGIYEVNVSGLEVLFEHTNTTGAVSVYVIPLIR